MQWIVNLLVLVICYLIGSIPFGLIFVKIKTGKDIRHVESGRTGGTNAMRAAGFWIGLATAIMDVVKGYVAVWIVRMAIGTNAWLEILGPTAAILGHNYSLFLLERKEDGKLHFRGGAGGAPFFGGSIGLWAPAGLFVLPTAGLIYYFIGYASVTTLSVAFLSMGVYIVTWWLGITPWQYILYSILGGFLLAWSLRPNIQRLIQGNERVVGYRARKKSKDQSSSSSISSS